MVTMLLIALIVVSGVGGPAVAQQTPAADATGKYLWVDTAWVESVDAEQGLVTVREPADHTVYAVDAATVIRRGGDTLAISGLSADDRIAISAHDGADVGDPPIADTITVVIEGSAE